MSGLEKEKRNAKVLPFTFSGKIIILSLYPRMTVGAPKSFINGRNNIRFYIVTIFIIISSKFLKMAFPINVIYEAFKPKVFTNRADNFFLHVYVNSNSNPINLDVIFCSDKLII